MPQLTENQIEYTKSNQQYFETVSAEKHDALLKKSATRWFKSMADFYSNKSENLSEDEQEKLDELIGTGIFFYHQFKEDGKTDYVDTVRELLTEYTELESADINEAMKNYDAMTAPDVEEPEQEEPQAKKAEAQPEPQSAPEEKEAEHSFFEIKLFDYLRARSHFEKRNPVGRFFSKLAGKIFRTGEYYVLSVKENHLKNDYGVPSEVLDNEYRNLNQKNTLDKLATDEVDYSSMSATDKEVNEFAERLKQDFSENKPEKTSKQVETTSPQVSKQLE